MVDPEVAQNCIISVSGKMVAHRTNSQTAAVPKPSRSGSIATEPLEFSRPSFCWSHAAAGPLDTAAVRKFARRATILTDTGRVQLCATPHEVSGLECDGFRREIAIRVLDHD